MREKVHILSIDGGGMYGVVAAEFCKAIEQELGSLKDNFDLMAGTSTGAILVGGFARSFPAQELQDLYFEEGPEIFKNPRGKFLGLYRRKPKYKGQYLSDALERRLGEDVLFKDIDKPLLAISAYNMSQRRTHYFNSWEDGNVKLWKAVAASSSAPTYHPMHEINGACYVDGGLFAVNPSMGALSSALQQEAWQGKDIVVVSLGTGCWHTQDHCNDRYRNEGELWWARNLPGAFLDGQDESLDESMHMLSKRADWLEYYRFDVFLDEKKKSDELDAGVLQRAISKAKKELDGSLKEKFESMIASLRSASQVA